MNAALPQNCADSFAPSIPVVLKPHPSNEPPSNYQHKYNHNQLVSVHSCRILPFSLASFFPPSYLLLSIFIDIKSFSLKASFCKARDKGLFWSHKKSSPFSLCTCSSFSAHHIQEMGFIFLTPFHRHGWPQLHLEGNVQPHQSLV